MKEFTDSAKRANDAIALSEHFLENPHEGTTEAWFRLAYAALRILANIADNLARYDEVVDHNIGCIVVREAEQ